MSLQAHDSHTLHILHRVAENGDLSQRVLASDLGIALGLANLLMRRLVEEGAIRVVRRGDRRASYVLTRTGIARKARLSRDYFVRAVRAYGEARDRVEARIKPLAARREPGSGIVLYGAGELAELAWLCAQRLSMRLVAVVDDAAAGTKFFGLDVLPLSALRGDVCDGQPFDIVVVTRPGRDSRVRARLQSLGIPADRICWLD